MDPVHEALFKLCDQVEAMVWPETAVKSFASINEETNEDARQIVRGISDKMREEYDSGLDKTGPQWAGGEDDSDLDAEVQS